MANGGGWLGVGVTHYTCTMISHLKSPTFLFHRVIFPKNGVEFCKQFNVYVIYSLAMIQHHMIIQVIKFTTIVFSLVVVFVLISVSTADTDTNYSVLIFTIRLWYFPIIPTQFKPH